MSRFFQLCFILYGLLTCFWPGNLSFGQVFIKDQLSLPEDHEIQSFQNFENEPLAEDSLTNENELSADNSVDISAKRNFVLYSEKSEFMESIKNHFYESDEGGAFLSIISDRNAVVILDCSKNDNCSDDQNSFFNYETLWLDLRFHSREGILQICYDRAYNLITRVNNDVGGECVDLEWSDVEKPLSFSKFNSVFDYMAMPAISVRSKSLLFTNWREEIRKQSDPQSYSLKSVFLGEEYAWSSWQNNSGDIVYSANEIIYLPPRKENGIWHTEFCLSQSINTVFDLLSDCYMHYSIPDYSRGMGEFLGVNTILISSSGSILGVDAMYPGDRFDLKEKFDAQVWNPIFEEFFTGFAYGLML